MLSESSESASVKLSEFNSGPEEVTIKNLLIIMMMTTKISPCPIEGSSMF